METPMTFVFLSHVTLHSDIVYVTIGMLYVTTRNFPLTFGYVSHSSCLPNAITLSLLQRGLVQWRLSLHRGFTISVSKTSQWYQKTLW